MRHGLFIHLTLLLKAMYDEQKVAVRTTNGMAEWFEIEQGIRQGCILSPHLLNIYSEMIMRKALHYFKGRISVGEYQITNLLLLFTKLETVRIMTSCKFSTSVILSKQKQILLFDYNSIHSLRPAMLYDMETVPLNKSM